MTERSISAGAADAGVDSETAGRRIVEAQFRRLPPLWRRADRLVIHGTHAALFAIGMAFTAMIALEVISRYVFSFSISSSVCCRITLSRYARHCSRKCSISSSLFASSSKSQ